jgi:diguanylate cyclase (GGDEF)-like protein
LPVLPVALLLVAGGLLRGTVRQWPLSPLNVAVVLLLACLFVLCDFTNLTIVVRRQALALSISEIPLVIGLFLLPPVGVLVARMISAALVIAYRRFPLNKFVVNLTISLAEVAVATAVFTYIGSPRPADTLAWLASYAAACSAAMVQTASVLTAMALTQGPVPFPRAGRMIGVGAVSALLSATVGLIVVVALSVNRWAAVPLAVLAAAAIFGFRAYGQSLRQHKSLTELYDFTKAIGTARQETSLVDSMLTRTRELLNADAATLWIPVSGRYPEIRLRTTVDTAGVVDDQLAADPVRRQAMRTARAVHVGSRTATDPELRTALRNRDVHEVIVVPLISGKSVIGCLEVTDRLGQLSQFGSEDVQLLETLAAHAAVAVENSRLVDRLRFDALHDPATGLPNRRRALAALDEALSVAPAPGEVVAVVEFDIDSLREINDTLGHAVGDSLLAEFGARLRAAAPPAAVTARVGGDEFAVVVRTDSAEINDLPGRLHRSLTAPYPIGNVTLNVGVTAGVAWAPDHAKDSETLLQRADIAVYVGKANRRNVQAYAPVLESRSTLRMGLVSELREALDHGQLEVHYQPKIGLVDREVVGVECLVRWNHPGHGLISPLDFVPVAEHTGLIGELTRQVLDHALSSCRRWETDGRPLGVSVNLSARTVADPGFSAVVEQMLQRYRVPADLLTVELTEAGLMGEGDAVPRTVRDLHDLGVRLSVDGFGTGASSLTQLRRLPLHEVKVDRSFVLGMATDGGDLAVVRAVVDLSRHLGLQAVAEGVENEMALSMLQGMSCDVAQGFLFARPLPYERLVAWLAARTEDASSTVDGRRRLRLVSERPPEGLPVSR